MICWNCKEETFDDGRFCVYCGSDLKMNVERKKCISLFTNAYIVLTFIALFDSICAFPLGICVTWYLMWFNQFGVCLLVVGSKAFLFCLLHILCLMVLFSMRKYANTCNITDYFRFVSCIRVCCIFLLTVFYSMWSLVFRVVSFSELLLLYVLELVLNIMMISLFSYVVRLWKVSSDRNLKQSLWYVWEKVGE